jgi:hypothetical protein
VGSENLHQTAPVSAGVSDWLVPVDRRPQGRRQLLTELSVSSLFSL